MKFGGTSVGSREAIERTIGIVRSKLAERPIVVVSAMSKVTDMLYAISDSLEAGDKSAAKAALAQLRKKHLDTATELMPSDHLWREEAFCRINDICDKMGIFIDSVTEIGAKEKAVINSKGEFLSSNMIYCKMNSLGIKTSYVNARDFMVTEPDYLQGAPVYDEIVRRAPKVIDAAFAAAEAIITQGFVGITAEGEETVLGRGGSDFSASIIGMSVDASKIEIWTDVDGVRSADPRKVDNTLCIPKISFEEAAEMAAYGAKVLHPKTIEPALIKNIPVLVLNSMNPEGQGTTIVPSQYIEDGVRSVSSKEKILLVHVSLPVVDDASALLTKTFEVLSQTKVEVDLLNVGPDGITFTTGSVDHVASAVVKISAFASVDVEEDKAQISVIGKNISELKLALKEASQLVKESRLVTVSQNDSYVNISFVVPRPAVQDAVRQIHTYLFEK